MNVIAIDPGTVTGWATASRSGACNLSPLHAAPSKGRSPEPEYARCGKLWLLLDRIATSVISAVICEGARGFLKGKAAVRVSNELRGVVKAWCWIRRAKYVEVQPVDLQRFVGGRGQVPKEEMLEAARTRLGYHGHDDNEADALWLLEWGRINLAVQMGEATKP